MEENGVKQTSKRGGKRPNAGRKASGITKIPVALKLDKDLFEILRMVDNRNRYINEAVKARLITDGLLYVNKNEKDIIK